MLIRDHMRVTFSCPHLGHGGVGLSEEERYSSKTSEQESQRYS